MRQVLLAAVAALLPLWAQAQTADELTKGAADRHDVLNYGMGYHLQRFSLIDQINKDNVKDLVPVWNYSYDDNRSEELQPLVYNGVLYVTTKQRDDRNRRQDRQADLENQSRLSARDAAHRLLRHHQPRCWPV